MRADMRNKITIIQRIGNVDEYGESTEEWSEFYNNVWASKEQLLGKEYYQAESFNSLVEVKYRTHWKQGVTNDMRIIDNGVTYEILSSINPKSLNRELLMYCRKVDV
jgi:SPP1 family predicted phage head-tail adaptor